MGKRKLRRQLNLMQVIMLGTAGVISTEIFVLTGHAAGIIGSATVFALLMGSLLSLSIVLNYSELTTAFPLEGSSLSYIGEAYGRGLLAFLIGSMETLASTFYGALAAIGFAYSVQVFIPQTPIIPTAIAILIFFILINLIGTKRVGNIQVFLGGILILIFAIYCVIGFVHKDGFSWETFRQGYAIFENRRGISVFSRLLMTIALIYNAFIGFEVIKDDSEEIENPNRNIPVGILGALVLATFTYTLVSLVTFGIVPANKLAGSSTAITDAANHFIPGWGVALMGIAGIIATITSINASMLGAPRQAFTLGRDGIWPSAYSKLNQYRSPWIAVLTVGFIAICITLIGSVELLSFISSSCYLFVLFWTSLAVMRLRKKYPNAERPFKTPFYPLTVYIAAGASLLVILFTDKMALLFGAGTMILLTACFYLLPIYRKLMAKRAQSKELGRDRFIVSVANPSTAKSLVNLAIRLTDFDDDTYICLLRLKPIRAPLTRGQKRATPIEIEAEQRELLKSLLIQAQEHNVPLYTKARQCEKISEGILSEINNNNNVKLLIAGWPGPIKPEKMVENPIKQVIQKAQTNIAILLDRGLMHSTIKRILVPVGGGPHSRLGIALANKLAQAENAIVTVLRILPLEHENVVDEHEDQTLWLGEIITEELGDIPHYFEMSTRCAETIQKGILTEVEKTKFDLIILGASEEWALGTRLFGAVNDWIADESPCSVLLCKRYEPVAISWLRRTVKGIRSEKGDEK